MAEITRLGVSRPTSLNPDRQVVNSCGDFVDRDHPNRILALERCVAALCAHGQQLWNDVKAMRTFLLHDQPPSRWEGRPIGQPRGDLGGDVRSFTTASGDAVGAADDADDPVAWNAAIAAYAAVTPVPTGPHDEFQGARGAPTRRVAIEDAVTAFATEVAPWTTAGEAVGMPHPGSA